RSQCRFKSCPGHLSETPSRTTRHAVVAQQAERGLGKTEVGSSNLPVGSLKITNADVAQLVAHHLAKVRVAGSSPVIRSTTPATTTSRGGGSGGSWRTR